MKIELEEPFKSRWRNGYLVFDDEGRRRVVLYNSNEDRWAVTYARYLMCVKLGYILPTELEVDHINDDKTDDRIDNLQVLTKEQNRQKQAIQQAENSAVYGACCAWCETNFLITGREIDKRIYKGVVYAFCSRSCAASYNHWLRKNS